MPPVITHGGNPNSKPRFVTALVGVGQTLGDAVVVTVGIAVLDEDDVSVFEGDTVLDGGLELLGVGAGVSIVEDGAELEDTRGIELLGVGVGVSVSVVDNEAELENTRVLVMIELEAEEYTSCVEVDREEETEKDEDEDCTDADREEGNEEDGPSRHLPKPA